MSKSFKAMAILAAGGSLGWWFATPGAETAMEQRSVSLNASYAVSQFRCEQQGKHLLPDGTCGGLDTRPTAAR